MSIRFNNFQEKRMKIFGEIVKMYWNGKLNTVEDLDKLTADIREKFNFEDHDMPRLVQPNQERLPGHVQTHVSLRFADDRQRPLPERSL